MLANQTLQRHPAIPPLVATALNDLATLLLHYRLRLDLIGRDGATTRVHPTPSPNQPPLKQALTGGEWRIATLIATGSTNREVAETLNISPKTVEAHLSHIYGKAGIRSRSELAVMITLASRASA